MSNRYFISVIPYFNWVSVNSVLQNLPAYCKMKYWVTLHVRNICASLIIIQELSAFITRDLLFAVFSKQQNSGSFILIKHSSQRHQTSAL